MKSSPSVLETWYNPHYGLHTSTVKNSPLTQVPDQSLAWLVISRYYLRSDRLVSAWCTVTVLLLFSTFLVLNMFSRQPVQLLQRSVQLYHQLVQSSQLLLSMWLPLSGAQTCFMNIFESSLYFSDPCFSHLVKLMGQTSDRKLQTCRPFPSPVFTKIVLFRKLQSRRENLWTQVSPKIITQTSTFTTLGKVSIFNLYCLPLSGQNRWGALLY